ncbi:aegerolysin family protein [Teichococcus aestuarii]|uniref:Peptidase C39-like domain-containing protein n=1 Tax=Teichococcus aestuarii TaxID=568898 RepID=A0A2U1UXX4_9PROT|nr:aegerolysin family protein [Pseudoroseomonas aestuarii]PWC26508.1 hypothetical protein CR165_22780 [Pseudoroseomonas aestuarii]
MAARSIRLTIRNRSDSQFVLSGASLDHGIWSPGQAPQQGALLLETDQMVLASESSGLMTGTAGQVTFSSVVLNGELNLFTFRWSNPWAGANSYLVEHVPPGMDAHYAGGDGDNAQVTVTIEAAKVLQTSFKPEIHGWRFTNGGWPSLPVYTLPPPFNIGIGNASNGLCGGMVFSAIDYFLAGRPIPPRTAVPATDQDPVYQYIASRLLDSFHIDEDLGIGTLNAYLGGMSQSNADRARATIKEALPKIRADIASGRPAALGIVAAQAANIFDGIPKLGQNHQVAAYSYVRNGSQVSLGIYDPNAPYNPAVPTNHLRMITLDAEQLAFPSIQHNLNLPQPQIFMFFRNRYAFVNPPNIS